MNTAQKGFTLIELMIVVAIIGILAAIAIPQYQNYIAKSQVSRVMSETGAIKTAVEDCVLNGKTAAGACELGWTASNLIGAGAAQDVNDQAGLSVTTDTDGAAVITATFGDSAATALTQEGSNTLQWDRSTDGTWSCSTSVAEKYRPTGCSADLGEADPE